jgi:predicted AlkP superfamily pyrophosphatase or phosphodiesterase
MRRHKYMLYTALLITIIMMSVQYKYDNAPIEQLPGLGMVVRQQHLVDRVYIILVDGLRYDAVKEHMPYTWSLVTEKKACIIKSQLKGPSNSRPGYARIFTGAATKINGISSNSQKSRCKIADIFYISSRCGLSTSASAFYWIGQLFNSKLKKDIVYYSPADSIQYAYFYGNENCPDSKVFKTAQEMIIRYKPDLCLIHPMGPDIAGHRYGCLSAPYADSVKKIDSMIEGVVNLMDFKNSMLVITSDHGHRDSGGHGGSSPSEIETPLVLYGSIIKGGIYSNSVSQEDIAPTICNLMGIPISPFMTGTVIDFPFIMDKRLLIG